MADPFDVFIYHAPADSTVGRGIQTLLEQHGLKVARGEAANIDDAHINQSAKVLVIWSPHAIQSDQVRAVATEAVKLGKYLPLLAAPCHDLLPPEFRRDDYITLDSPGIETLLHALALPTETEPADDEASQTYDLFISYARADNAPETGNPGWIAPPPTRDDARCPDVGVEKAIS